MTYSQIKKYCFIAPPKTGTTTITHALDADETAVRDRVPSGGDSISVSGHVTAREVALIVGEELWSSLFSFATVRNPWDRVVSSYFFYKNGLAAEGVMSGRDRRRPIALRVASAKLLPFNIWVWIYRPLPCADYVTDANGKVIVSKIYRFEEYASSFRDICRRLGIPEPEMKKANASNHMDFRSYYNSASVRLVERRCRSDVELFGYRFEE